MKTETRQINQPSCVRIESFPPDNMKLLIAENESGSGGFYIEAINIKGCWYARTQGKQSAKLETQWKKSQ